jgi:thiamine kinase-like enzyme
MAFDLANCLNETMIDNAHAEWPGIKFYFDNMPTDQERLSFLTHYLKRYFNEFEHNSSFDEYLVTALPKFDDEVKRCMLLSNFLWATWGLEILKDSEITDISVFNYPYV